MDFPKPNVVLDKDGRLLYLNDDLGELFVNYPNRTTEDLPDGRQKVTHENGVVMYYRNGIPENVDYD